MTRNKLIKKGYNTFHGIIFEDYVTYSYPNETKNLNCEQLKEICEDIKRCSESEPFHFKENKELLSITIQFKFRCTNF